MKLEEAKEFSLKKMICKQSQIPFLRLLDKIYDDFKLELEAEYKRGWKDRATQSDLENRTCRHCKFYGAEHEHISHPNYRTCINRESFTYMIEPHFEDGCNKWEQK